MPAYSQYTRADIRGMLQERIEDVPFWVDAEANDAINEALLVWNSLTGLWKGTQTITTTPNSWEYALDASIIFGMSVSYENIPLAPTSKAEMDAGRPGWQSQTTTDGDDIPTTPQFWLPISIDLIAIWPADAAGGHTLRVLGVSATPVMDSDGDYVEIGAEQLNAILNYSLHALALKEGGERFAATLPLFSDFLKGAAGDNAQLLSSSFFRAFSGIDMGRQERPTKQSPNDYEKVQL